MKTQYTPLTEEQVLMMQQREEQGYYLPENIQARSEAKQAEIARKKMEEITIQRDKRIAQANREFSAQKAVLDAGFFIDNFIYYSHSDTGLFNWRQSADLVSREKFDAFINSDLSKIEGITWKFGEDKK